jgi:hypothetical protein
MRDTTEPDERTKQAVTKRSMMRPVPPASLIPAEGLQPLEPNGLELTANALRDSGIRSDDIHCSHGSNSVVNSPGYERPAENLPS